MQDKFRTAQGTCRTNSGQHSALAGYFKFKGEDTVDDKKNIATDLLSKLSLGMDKRSDISKLRELIVYIETALSSGVCRKDVLETIRTSLDINMNIKTFEKNLYRIRKKQKTGKLAGTPKTNQKINAGSQQLTTISTNVSKTTVKDTVPSKNFISPGDIKNQRIIGLEDAWKVEKEIYNLNDEETNQ